MTERRRGRKPAGPIGDLDTYTKHTVTPRQVAEHCDVSLQTVYKWIRSGVLPRDMHYTRDIRITVASLRLFKFTQLRKSTAA